MSKKTVFGIICLSLILTLGACSVGTTEASSKADVVEESSKVEMQNEIPDETNATEDKGDSIISDPEENRAGITPDSLLPHPDDDTYFKPETNDWLITVKIRNDYDPAKTVMTLYSFDSSGNLVQVVEREANSDGSELVQAPSDEPDMYQTLDRMVNYYNRNRSIDYFNEYKHVSDKYYEYYLLNRRDPDFADVFYSPGLLKDDTERVNPEDEIYNEFCRVGELTGSDYFIYNLRFEERDDGYFLMRGKDVKEYDGYSVYTADIDCFDENGRNIAGYSVMVFDDENHVDDYFMRSCGYDLDHYLETEEVRINQSAYERASKDTVIMGNILYRKDPGYYNKGEAMTSTDGYFSIPYLTDAQIKTLTLMK